MARHSHRKAMLGALHTFGKDRGGLPEKTILHTVLGKAVSGEKADARAPHLVEPDYLIPGQSRVYGNGVATNGVMLPVRGVTNSEGKVERLEGTISVRRNGPFFFVAAPWEEIAPVYKALLPQGDELFITNGRFNHLWNNMFHHLRNDYVNQRYPEDLPGDDPGGEPRVGRRADPGD